MFSPEKLEIGDASYGYSCDKITKGGVLLRNFQTSTTMTMTFQNFLTCSVLKSRINFDKFFRYLMPCPFRGRKMVCSEIVAGSIELKQSFLI